MLQGENLSCATEHLIETEIGSMQRILVLQFSLPESMERFVSLEL
jgi:hypothetical protein